jgi:bacterioferritin (cytochrome b1)
MDIIDECVNMEKKELIEMFNDALELEHAARIQYLAHAEEIIGYEAEPIIARLKEIAEDEKKHEDLFRDIIGSYLGGTPSMCIAETHCVKTTKEILETNLKDEKHAVDVYEKMMEEIKAMKKDLKYEYYQIEHKLRHVIIDEQEHIAELKLLLGMQ